MVSFSQSFLCSSWNQVNPTSVFRINTSLKKKKVLLFGKTWIWIHHIHHKLLEKSISLQQSGVGGFKFQNSVHFAAHLSLHFYYYTLEKWIEWRKLFPTFSMNFENKENLFILQTITLLQLKKKKNSSNITLLIFTQTQKTHRQTDNFFTFFHNTIYMLEKQEPPEELHFWHSDRKCEPIQKN